MIDITSVSEEECEFGARVACVEERREEMGKEDEDVHGGVVVVLRGVDGVELGKENARGPRKELVRKLRIRAASLLLGENALEGDEEVARVRLIDARRGRALQDGDLFSGEAVLALLEPSVPEESVRRGEVWRRASGRAATARSAADEEDDAMMHVKFSIASLTWPTARRLATYMRHTLKMSDATLNLLLVILQPFHYVWFCLLLLFGPLAARLEMGPLFVIVMLFILMLANLSGGTSKRRDGISAYAMLNPNAQALPGQFDANDVNRLVMGRM